MTRSRYSILFDIADCVFEFVTKVTWVPLRHLVLAHDAVSKNTKKNANQIKKVESIITFTRVNSRLRDRRLYHHKPFTLSSRFYLHKLKVAMDDEMPPLVEMTRRERVLQLHHDGPRFMPLEWISEHVFPGVAMTITALVVLFVSFIVLVNRNVSSDTPALKRYRLAYQATNLLVNCYLGVSGIYYELYLKPKGQMEVEELITNYNHFQMFGNFQLGYQLWAIPVGILLVAESTPMLVHHFATILVATMSSFSTNGFRFYGSFFYGLIEITSVPLSIMNTFKDHPKWIERHGLAYLVVRLVFALSFLYVRLYLFIPCMYHFLTDLYLYLSTSDNQYHQAYLTVVWGSSFFLQILQVWWGSLIIKGLVKVVIGGGGSKSEDDDKIRKKKAK